MIKEDVLQYLKDEGYLLHVDGKNIITNKFLRELGVSSNNSKPVITKSKLVEVTKEDYKQFIVDAEVPTVITTGNSKFFANRYSESGFKAFKEALSTIDKQLLLAATKYYYKQTNTARVMVGNFFSQGIYESFVDDIKKAIAKRDAKTTVLDSGKDYGNILPTFLDDSISNMEQG